MSELNEMSCEEFEEVAAELALGVLTGRERAAALEHLDRCEACRTSVRQLSMTGDELLGLLPVIEPPPGFETRVLDRLGIAATAPAAPARGGRIRRLGRSARTGPARRTLAAAAVVVAVLASVVGGWGLRAATSSPPASPLSSATLLTATHQSAGKIYLYDSGSRWLYMSVNIGPGGGAAGNGPVLCQVVGPDGHVTTVGSFQLTDGYGYWGSPDPATNGHPAGARIVTTTGTVLATATFPT